MTRQDITDQLFERGWMVVQKENGYCATRGEVVTPHRQTMEAVLEDCNRIACHTMPGELGPNGDRAKQSLKTEYSCNSVTSKGPVAEGAGATLDWYNDALQLLVFDRYDDPLLHVRLNADGTVAEIVMRERALLSLCSFEGEVNETSPWQKARDGE